MTLMTIADTPHSIALGSAIGIFFGFTPLYPFKTLLSIAAAWICRCNKVAAAIAVTVHDIVIFAMPAIYFVEYKLGCWILQRPPPQRLRLTSFSGERLSALGIFSAGGLASSDWIALHCRSQRYSDLLNHAAACQPSSK